MTTPWSDRAACRGLDPLIFFPATDEEAEPAKAVCAQCAVQEICWSTRSANGSAKVSGVGARSGNDGGSSGVDVARRRSPAGRGERRGRRRASRMKAGPSGSERAR